MTKQYTTIRQVLVATLEKYQGVTRLSRKYDTGLDGGAYTHEYNGVGCAIGCHLTPQAAAYLDSPLRSSYGVYSVSGLLKKPSRKRNILRARFADSISVTNLRDLQSLHDNALSAEDFRISLRAWIDRLPEEEES